MQEIKEGEFAFYVMQDIDKNRNHTKWRIPSYPKTKSD